MGALLGILFAVGIEIEAVRVLGHMVEAGEAIGQGLQKTLPAAHPHGHGAIEAMRRRNAIQEKCGIQAMRKRVPTAALPFS
ncbi:hypothetical protein ACFSTI_11630 [Rhizorhabdus histidinilytica]